MTIDELVQQSGEWLKGTGPDSDVVISSRHEDELKPALAEILGKRNADIALYLGCEIRAR